MVRRHRKPRGVTLVEVMVTVAILSIVFSLGPALLTNVTRFTRLSSARVETQRNARDALNQINQALRQASASTIVITNETAQSPFSAINFTTIDGRALKFYQEGDGLRFVQNGSTVAVADGLRYIAFSYPRTDNSKIVSVSVTFEKATYQGGTKALQMAIEKVRIMND
jgi:prepilin-type N-terminal cleavage/methylation domain-containing protein